MTIKNQDILKRFGNKHFESGRVRRHKLNVPLENITEVVIRPLTLAEHCELDDGENMDEIEIISVMTSLDEETLEELKTPDWNAIVGHVNELRNSNSYQLAKKRYQPKDHKVAIIFVDEPYWVEFEEPSVGLSRKLSKQKDRMKRLELYLSNLTDLSPDQIKSMPMPDYNMLDAVVTDFLSQRADYFQ
ncbi:hypothetical protein GTG28_20710 [Vibrio sp. OCN044]|uniref:Uncharacterized protein n=1 Tax=Vibrio tetraodonis subsp. pristinus TaxID=2695891 RepID=A0A6L8M271_9VIBR|nr:phage tail assembly protein [Vibrio tetraodonis]MYM61626.1 hypothetical protein [Vibrio tetraodonis subsp. pristinus]